MKREETKNGEAKTRDGNASGLNGDSYRVFDYHQPSPLPTQLPPAFPPLPHRRPEARRKIEGQAHGVGKFVKLKSLYEL